MSSLKEELEKQGNWLFKWRSYLPILVLLISPVILKNSEYLNKISADGYKDSIWEILCLLISFTGLFIRCLTVGYVPEGTSGRNTKEQQASTLNTTGIYSIVRHPLYFGNFIIFMGLALFPGVWWFIIISVLGFCLYYERIIFAEEEFLQEKFGTSFLEWAEKTPAFIPKLKKWQKPGIPFSFRNVLKREYSGFFGIIVYFTILEITGDIITKGKLKLDLGWIILFASGLVIYLTLITLKKKSRILHVKGR